MKFKLFRKSSLFLPIFLIAAFMYTGAESALIFLCCYAVILFFTADMPGSFRNASASQPGIRRVDAFFLGALIQGAVGVLLCFAVGTAAKVTDPSRLSTFVATALLIFEHLFEERLYAVGRRIDATLLALITSVLAYAGFSLENPVPSCIAALLIAMIVTLVNQPLHFRRPLSCIFFAPRALLRDFCCPAVMSFLALKSYASPLICIAGIGITRFSGTFARCSPDETRLPRLLISCTMLIAAAVNMFYPEYSALIPISAASLIALLVDMCIDIRTLICIAAFIVTTLLSLLNYPLYALISALSGMIIAFDKRVFLKKV